MGLIVLSLTGWFAAIVAYYAGQNSAELRYLKKRVEELGEWLELINGDKDLTLALLPDKDVEEVDWFFNILEHHNELRDVFVELIDGDMTREKMQALFDACHVRDTNPQGMDKPKQFLTSPDSFHKHFEGRKVTPEELMALPMDEFMAALNDDTLLGAIDPTDLTYPDPGREGGVVLGPDEDPPIMFSEIDERRDDERWDDRGDSFEMRAEFP